MLAHGVSNASDFSKNSHAARFLFEMNILKKVSLAAYLALGISFTFISITFLKDIFDGRTKIVFCDVGQGDGAYIRTSDKTDILVDAGPDKKILYCLGKHMPFLDRTIEVAFLSHPQKDHYGGYSYLLDRYRINTFIMSPLDSPNKTFSDMKKQLREKNVVTKILYKNARVQNSSRGEENWIITMIYPDREVIASTHDGGIPTSVGDLMVLRSGTDPNEFSLVFMFSQEKINTLFTGDASPSLLKYIEKTVKMNYPQGVTLLKVPHHGSRNGLTRDFLQLADPAVSVISVGKRNAYGHPSKEIISLFKALKKKYIRTDENGDVIIYVKGGRWDVN